LNAYRAQTFKHSPAVKEVKAWLRAQVEKDIPLEVFKAEIYEDCLGAPCPECGQKYGEKWYSRELPPEIVELAETVLADEE
jgi:hypothetical protein